MINFEREVIVMEKKDYTSVYVRYTKSEREELKKIAAERGYLLTTFLRHMIEKGMEAEGIAFKKEN
jgi:predicted DNA binding CopG/RHH family protein